MKDNQKASGAKTFLDKKNYKTNTQCRMCGSTSLTLWLDLGDQPLANSFLKKSGLKKSEPAYPLRVFFCTDCGLSQLIDVVKPAVMFRDYVYFSSGMPKVSEHWKSYAEDVVQNYADLPNDFVLEIGSNDGVLLGVIQKLGAKVLGIDPAKNIAKVANQRGISTLPEFFSERLARKVQLEHGYAKAIVGNNVVAHIDNHNDLLAGVDALLHHDGVFIFEAPYLVDMFKNLSFDTVYHEHASYLSLKPIQKWLAQRGLEAFYVKVLPIQGNSIRVYACRKGTRKVDPSVAKLLKKEKSLGMDTVSAYKGLAKKIQILKKDVTKVLRKLKKEGKSIGGYGAPAKGNTLLNYFGIDTGILDFLTEELPSKIGSHSPGMHIPVVHVQDGRDQNPDYFFMLAWNYKPAILAKEKDFIENGGKFIMPIGNIRIIP